MNILVTGGAGFIGSHIVDGLLGKGHKVRVLDCLDPQVHGKNPEWPQYLNPDTERVLGDVRQLDTVKKALVGIDAVFHEAAAVGVGQSMYQIRHYTDVNTMGAATLLEAAIHHKSQLKKLIVASSMSIYGEGRYSCSSCGTIVPKLRPETQLQKKAWEIICPSCAGPTQQQPTDESKPLQPNSIYAINKRDHEEMFLVVGQAYKIPTVALRYFNVYGPRQALSNPYTGVAAIFSSRLLNNKQPFIYEDGLQSRDFVHVTDIVQANLLALESPDADGQVFNVGTGQAQTIVGVAELLSKNLGMEPKPEIVAKFRAGDVRHCFADITKISKKLGYQPKIYFEDGVKELVEWVRTQKAQDLTDNAAQELQQRGLST